MQTLQFSITINAPKEKVWSTMLDLEPYKVWSSAFMEGSMYKGSWEEGSKMLFVAPNEAGKMEGMVSRIKENRPHEFISIEHLGFISDGVEDTTSDKIKDWVGAHENYTFKDLGNNTTEVIVDIDVAEEMKDDFENMWPAALKKLKELAEK